MVTSEQLRNVLAKYVPAGAIDTCADWIKHHRISVRIKKSRATKYGDYRPPMEGRSHIITINHDLNPYAFLITFTHEVAHLTCFNKHRERVMPHGEEWKSEFRYLLRPFLTQKIFPEDVAVAVSNYLHNPAASSCSDTALMKALRRYDQREDGWTHLEDLPIHAKFITRNGQYFVKGELLRKNYVCFDLNTKHKYFIHGLMEVRLME